MENKTRMAFKSLWVLVLVVAGLLLNHFRIGMNEFVGFGSVGTYLVYIGFIGAFVVLLSPFLNRNKVVDERMEFVGAKAMRATFLFLVMVLFAVMLLDGIQAITLPYHLFASYIVAGLLAVYFVSYKVLLRFH